MVYTIGMTFSRTNHPNHHFTKKRVNKQNRYSKCAEKKKNLAIPLRAEKQYL